MRHAKKLLLLLLPVAAAALALAACGGGGNTGGATQASSTTETGGDTVTGAFAAVAGAPSAFADVGGEAVLTRAGGGTEVTIELTGLEPETEYMAHLHTEGCGGSDPGGPHFQFEKGGSEEPPNEIHFQFESNAAGEGKAVAKSDREVPQGEAGSVVVHYGGQMQMSALRFTHEEGGEMGHEHGEKLACAPLEGEAAGASAEAEQAGSGAEETGVAIPTIDFENGEAVGGVQKIEVNAGEEVRFLVHSDVAEEVHVHGYDLMKDVPAGGTVEFDFPAEIEGIFEAEMEGVGVQILELQVNP